MKGSLLLARSLALLLCQQILITKQKNTIDIGVCRKAPKKKMQRQQNLTCSFSVPVPAAMCQSKGRDHSLAACSEDRAEASQRISRWLLEEAFLACTTQQS